MSAFSPVSLRRFSLENRKECERKHAGDVVQTPPPRWVEQIMWKRRVFLEAVGKKLQNQRLRLLMDG